MAPFAPSDDNMQIKLTKGQRVTVLEGFDVVAELLDAEGPTDC